MMNVTTSHANMVTCLLTELLSNLETSVHPSVLLVTGTSAALPALTVNCCQLGRVGLQVLLKIT